MAKLTNLHQMFLHELQDLASAESQILKALPKMISAAENDELREAFEKHLGETEGHLEKLTALLESFDEGRGRTKCAAMAGILAEGADLMKSTADQSTCDAALIAAAQKVEHYEMCGYGTMRAWAEELGHRKAIDVFDSIFAEEKAADEKLTDIASSANPAATDAREMVTTASRASAGSGTRKSRR